MLWKNKTVIHLRQEETAHSVVSPMKETSISVLLPWPPPVLEMAEVLKAQVILEPLTL